MYKLDNFTIYIQTFTLTVLAILPTLVVSGKSLYCVPPHACSCATLSQDIRSLTVLPPRTFRVPQKSWLLKNKTKPMQLPKSPTNGLAAMTKKDLSQFGYSQEAGD